MIDLQKVPSRNSKSNRQSSAFPKAGTQAKIVETSGAFAQKRPHIPSLPFLSPSRATRRSPAPPSRAPAAGRLPAQIDGRGELRHRGRRLLADLRVSGRSIGAGIVAAVRSPHRRVRTPPASLWRPNRSGAAASPRRTRVLLLTVGDGRFYGGPFTPSPMASPHGGYTPFAPSPIRVAPRGDGVFYGCGYSPFTPSPARASPLGAASLSTPSSSASRVDDDAAAAASEHRVHMARLAMQYQDAANRYQLCVSQLADAALRLENSELRVANNHLADVMLGGIQGAAVALSQHFGQMPAPPMLPMALPASPALQMLPMARPPPRLLRCCCLWRVPPPLPRSSRCCPRASPSVPPAT